MNCDKVLWIYQSIFRELEQGRDCMSPYNPIPFPSEEHGSSRMAIAPALPESFRKSWKTPRSCGQRANNNWKRFTSHLPVRSGFVWKIPIKSCMKTGILKDGDLRNPIGPGMNEELLQIN